MDEHLEQIAEMLQACEDFPVDETDLADAPGVVKSVREVIDWSAKARQSSRDNASARDAYLRDLEAARRATAQWRDEAATWQARYEGMEAALRVALEVRK